MNDIVCYLKDDNNIICNVVNSVYIVKPETTDLNITPTKEAQLFKSEDDKYFKDVLINAIPDEYIVPSGEIEFTQNGTYDVTDKASAKVNIKEKILGTKTITSNGTYKAIDDNLDGYSEVIADVQIDIDIKQYMIESDLEFKYGANFQYELMDLLYTQDQVNRVKELINILGGTNNG